MSPELFRDILFSVSGLSFGAAGVAVVTYGVAFIQRRNRTSALGHILVKVGWIASVGVVFSTILVTTSQIPPTTEGWIYLGGISIATVGFLLVAYDERRRDRAPRVARDR